MNDCAATLVVPTYNRAHLVSETIQSALQQSKPFFEIIVVDDGSNDNTSQILDKYSDFIKIITTKNKGVQAARNLGIGHAKTELVVLCDSDDLLEPEYVETLAPWMHKNTAHDVLYCNFQNFSEGRVDKDKLGLAPFDFLAGAQRDGPFAYSLPNLYLRSILYQPLFTSGMMLRKTFFKSIGGYNTDFRGMGAEDWEFTLRAISCGQVAVCALPLVRVRRHKDNDSGSPIHMSLGEADILEYSIKNHLGASVYWDVVSKSILRRRIDGLDAAYLLQQFDRVDQIFHKFHSKELDIKTRMKYLISRLPSPLRDLLWRISVK